MEEKDKEYREQLDRYDERHRFWQDKALNQLGIATNIFLVISIGFMTYLIDKKNLHYVFTHFNQFGNVLYLMALITSFFGIISGLFCVLSRLYDLRLTRHAIWIRKKTYRKHKIKLSDSHISLKEYRYFKGVKNLFSSIINRKYYIDDEDIEDKEAVIKKFKKLRKRVLYLGRFSWNSLIGQILAIFISFLFIVIYLATTNICCT